jgi:hypothetical protein
MFWSYVFDKQTNGLARFFAGSAGVSPASFFNPNSEVGEHARHGRGGMRLAFRTSGDDGQIPRPKLFGRLTVSREGAGNCARGGRAPISDSEFGLKAKFPARLCFFAPLR